MIRLIVGVNDLATVRPELVKEWHPTKNGDLTPTQVCYGAGTKVWWLGSCGHEWEMTVNHRSSGIGCPYCSGARVLRGFNDLATYNPELVDEWHPTKNGDLTPYNVARTSCKKVWWLGACGHEWESSIYNRSKGSGCPYCAGQAVLQGVNDLESTHPELAAEWHPTKNGDLKPSDVTACSGKRVWWMCSKGHEWQAIIADRYRGRGCPVCANRKVLAGYNDLATVNPALAAEWHPTKNGDLKPSDVTKGSVKKVWWLCSVCGREWEAQIMSRSHGAGCRACSKKKLKRGQN